METPIIELQDIRKSFGPVEVLKGVDMQVYAGKVTALVGDNGAGKSTLIKGLSGAQPYDSGDVSFDGAADHPQLAAGRVQHGIEVVYQDLSLCENLDIVQNMFLGREEVHQRMLNQAEMEKHATADAAVVVRPDHEVGTSEGLLAVRRSAPDCGDRSRRAAEGEVGHPRRADGCARCGANRTGAGARPPPCRRRGRRHHHQPQPCGRVRGGGLHQRALPRRHGGPVEDEARRTTTTSSPTSPASRATPRLRKRWKKRRWSHDHAGRKVDESVNGHGGPNGRSAPPPTQISTGHEGTVRDQIDSYLLRIRGGEMGMLPALAGVVIITIVFFILTPYFLTKTNIANLMTQTAALMMLAVALTFVIILAEIDLSAGVTGGLGMAVFILLTAVGGWNWIAALLVALVVGASIGTFIGFMVAKIGVPSFVITLALFLGLQGVILVLLGNAGAYRIEAPAVLAIMNKSMPVWAGWLMLAVIVAISLFTGLYDRSRRVATGMPVRPMSLLWARVAAWAVGGGLVVLLLSLNRSTSVIPIRGVPVVVPIALAILWIGTTMLDRTRFGLHIYAVGGNPEAARRAGINVSRVRIACFILCSSLAVISGLFTASQVGTVESSAGRDIVLSGVAAAVVGGVSLFGGRGRLAQAAVGALLISMITNGLGLLGLSAGITLAITGAVLALAATVDALSRRRSGSTSLARG